MSPTSRGTKVVRLSPGIRGEPIDVGAFHVGIVDHCADAIAMFARQRAELPRSTVAETERRIGRQRDALLSLQGDQLVQLGLWSERSVESDDPWKAWAAVFALGALGGATSCGGVLAVLEHLADDGESWAAAAEALALVEPDADLEHELLASPRAAAQAVGLDMLSRHRALPTDVLKRHIDQGEPAVRVAALRAIARMGVTRSLAREIAGCLGSTSRAVAWEAARALTLAGLPEPYLEVRSGGPLASVLGPRGVELFVMAGEDLDIGACEALLAGSPMSAPLLSTVARFGNVTAWSFLLHYLADPELVNEAVRALRTLFGDLVPEAEIASFSAWTNAILAADFDPVVRYRGGKPWSPSTVLAECASGTLSRVEVDLRVDELAARTGAVPRVAFGLWEPDARRELAAFAEDAGERGAWWRPGAWR